MTKLMVSHVLSACFVIVYPIQACFGYVLVYLIRIKAKSNDLFAVDLLILLVYRFVLKLPNLILTQIYVLASRGVSYLILCAFMKTWKRLMTC